MGSIPMSILGELITSVKEGEFYTFTECRLCQYYGKCLTITQLTTVSVGEKAGYQCRLGFAGQTFWMLLSTHSWYAVTKTVHKKKIVTTPGSQIAKCHHCNRSMLVKNCYFDMAVSPSLEKDGKQYSVTTFSEAISPFRNEDNLLLQGPYWSPRNQTPSTVYWKELIFNFPTPGSLL